MEKFIQDKKPTGKTDIPSLFLERLKESPISLIPKDFSFSLKNIREFVKNREAFVCDTNIDELVSCGEKIENGWKKDNITNIDHHFSNDERFERFISSTNLAIDYVNKNGTTSKDSLVIINHTDCDSILSSSILRGIIPPDTQFGDAAIAADHTGKENAIGDLLQSIEKVGSVEFSLKNLELLLNREELDEGARALLDKRLEEREKIKNLIENNLIKYSTSKDIAYTELEERIDGALFPALLKEAKLIVLFSPRSMKDNDGNILPGKQAKVRLGITAKDIDLREIMKQVDPNFGGRWNAGANDRKGGLLISTEEYIEKLETVLVNMQG